MLSDFQLIMLKLDSISNKVDGVANDLSSINEDIKDKLDLMTKEFSNLRRDIKDSMNLKKRM